MPTLRSKQAHSRCSPDSKYPSLCFCSQALDRWETGSEELREDAVKIRWLGLPVVRWLSDPS